jgi:hypothetical protein
MHARNHPSIATYGREGKYPGRVRAVDVPDIDLFWDRNDDGEEGWVARFWVHGKPIDVRLHGEEGLPGWHNRELSPVEAQDMVLAAAEHLSVDLPTDPAQLTALIDKAYRARRGPP